MPINVIVEERDILAGIASARGISLVEFVKGLYLRELSRTHPGDAEKIAALRKARYDETRKNRLEAARKRFGKPSSGPTVREKEAVIRSAEERLKAGAGKPTPQTGPPSQGASPRSKRRHGSVVAGPK